MPAKSPATGLPNEMYPWRGQSIRYQTTSRGDDDDRPAAVLVHGLFVNSDHWRYTLKGLDEAGYRAYAVDLLGCGYSSRPDRDSLEARALCGERGRFADEETKWERRRRGGEAPAGGVAPAVELGAADGTTRAPCDVDLKHPLGSCYNFYTWAELVGDFTEEVIFRNGGGGTNRATIVCNSIGTISSLVTTIDRPDLFDGIFIIAPNFRELHSAEIPFPGLAMPAIRVVQRTLRENGQGLFDALAKPDTVKQILMEPYKVPNSVDDTLVDVLLSPLLLEGSADVVFDTLSYSAGPLPEQLLGDKSFPGDVPVWVCYGEKDPWTPGPRVERLGRSFGSVVERVVKLDGVGHCPHDEAPKLVNPLLMEFMGRVKEGSATLQ